MLVSPYLASSARSQPTITGSFTVDNAYSVWLGTATSVTTNIITASNMFYLSQIRQGETFTFQATPGCYIYIATWSDDASLQGMVGSFSGNLTLKTGDPQIQVAPGFINYGPYPPQLSGSPTQAQINAVITAGNWTAPFVAAPVVPAVAPFTAYSPLVVPGLDPTARWVWYDSGNDPGAKWPFSPYVPFKGFNHDEFLVWRVPCDGLIAKTSLYVQKIFEYPAGMTVATATALQSAVSTLPFNVDVTCTPPGATPPTVTVTYQQGALASNIPGGGACTITEQTPLPSLPAPYASCTWGTPKLSFDNNPAVPNGSSSGPLQQTQGGDPHYVAAINTITCPTTSLEVKKTVVGPKIGTALATQQFDIYVNCTPSGPNTVIPLTQGGSLTLPNILVGSDCTIREKPPLLPEGYPSNCTWQTTIMIDGALPPGLAPPGVLPPNGYTFAGIQALPDPHIVQVINTIDCPMTSLLVGKTMQTPAWMSGPMTSALLSAVSQLQFQINVSCTFPGATPSTFTINYLAGQLVSNIPIGSNCTITEQTPLPSLPAPYSSCTWGTPQLSFGVTFGIANGSSIGPLQQPQGGGPNYVWVNNKLDCPGGSEGSLTITKTVTVDGNPANWPGLSSLTFQVDVSCQPPPPFPPQPPSQPFTLSIGLTYATPTQTVNGITTGTTCSIAEQAPANIFPGNCHWATTYPLGTQVTIQPGNQTLLVHNEQSCATVPPNQAQLGVTKVLSILGRADTVHAMTFQVFLTCPSLNGGTPQPLPLTPTGITLTGYYSASMTFAVAPGDTCTISEPTLPPLSSNLADCTWAPGTPTYTAYASFGASPGASVTASAAQQQYGLQVTNTLTCPPLRVQTPPYCPPDTVLRGHDCVPPPTVCPHPMIPGRLAGQCVCPQGTAQKGRHCVRQLQCARPMIPNAGRTGCVCPPGTMQRGRACVRKRSALWVH